MISTFERDVRRCSTVNLFMEYWNEPKSRFVFERSDNDVEIYKFHDIYGEYDMFYFASYGASLDFVGSRRKLYEVCFGLPEGLGGATDEEVSILMMNIIEHSYREDVRFSPHEVLPPVSFAPNCWKANAFLLDHPRWAEDNSIESYNEQIEVIQLLVINKTEYKSVLDSGISNLHQRLQDVDLPTLYNPNRDPVL